MMKAFLSYNRLSQIPKWADFVIDNGHQGIVPGVPTYTCSKNIGCAAGWNLIANIAFNYFEKDKVIICQDDCIVPQIYLEQMWEETDGLSITGALIPYFEFSCFCITKEVWELVGRFDESFWPVYCEDADYKHRCYLAGVSISTLNLPLGLNESSSPKIPAAMRKNKNYLLAKWGSSINPNIIAQKDNQPPFAKRYPKFVEQYNDREYTRFKELGFSN